MSFYSNIGDVTVFSKTVGEADVYAFAGITGDFSPNHVNEQVMRQSQYGGRIAHGALLVGYMSTASTMACGDAGSRRVAGGEMPVSLGYDRLRFLKGVRFGDTITVTYTISEIDIGKRRSVATVDVTNQDRELVATAKHIIKWVPV